MTPREWNGAIIQPLLKSRSSDPRIPLNYRGISLINRIAKLYCATLNRRLLLHLKSNELLPDEQCGFRPGRGCDDQLYVFYSAVQSQIQNDMGVFTAFID